MITKQTKTKLLPGLMLASSLLFALPLLTGCNNSGSSEAVSHINRAETYSEQGQFRSALLEVKSAIQEEPDNIDHTVQLANLYLRVGGAQEASELLAPWLEEQPEAVGLPLARAYIEQGKHLSARETLALQTPTSPDEELEASLIRGEIQRKSGELEKALARYKDLAASHPSNTEAITGVIHTQIDLGKNAQAIKTADEWLEKNDQAPEVLYRKGLAQYRLKQLEQSSDTLTDAVSVLPTSDIFLPIRRNLLIALSRVLTEQGKITDAQIYNQILAENQNTDAREQAKAAVAAVKEGNFSEAKAILQDTHKLDPENERVALLLGTISAGTGELDEGAQLLTENLDPETTPTQFIRAATMAQIDTGDREAALKTLSRAIEARPKDNELLAMHGVLALSLPDHEKEGITSLSKAISNEPGRVRLRLALARHYLKNERPEQALGQLRMAFTAAPHDWTTTGNYLNLLIEQGEDQEAAEIRDSLLNGYSDQPRAVLLASLTDARLGNTDQAIKQLEELAEDRPERQVPKIALAGLYAQSGKREMAVDLLVDAAVITPDQIRPLQQAGKIYMQDHSAAETKTWLADTAKNYPELEKNSDTLSALVSVNQGELAEARATLSQWSDSDDATVTRAYGQLLLAEAKTAVDSEKWSEARAKAAEAIALEPENLGYALLPVKVDQMEGKIENAFSALAAVEKTHGEVTATMLSRTELLNQQKGPKAAYRYLSDKWQETNNPQLMPFLIKLARNQAPETLEDLTESWLNETPKNFAAHLARAEWLMSDNQETAAKNHYEQVLAAQPGNVSALNNLAWVLREDDSERALTLARQASERAPESPAVLDTYGWVLHRAGKHEEAKTVIEKALTLAPNNTEIQEHLEAIKQKM